MWMVDWLSQWRVCCLELPRLGSNFMSYVTSKAAADMALYLASQLDIKTTLIDFGFPTNGRIPKHHKVANNGSCRVHTRAKNINMIIHI